MAASFGISYFQFQEKGFLFNNAYLYASEEERRTMNKKPYYRQSGIVFFLVGFIFLLNILELVLSMSWLFYLMLLLCAITLIYAIISSIKIETAKK
ncbi:MAG: DUF3784 domain-containing protein [Lachnospiraceae bacterium]|nr:DUF3784 domain-containing protein [Lachnospiraceae bacterium]